MAKIEQSYKFKFFTQYSFEFVDWKWVYPDLDRIFKEFTNDMSGFERWAMVDEKLDKLTTVNVAPDVYFLRYWLDQTVRWMSDNIWNYAHEQKLLELKGEKKADRKAQKYADEVEKNCQKDMK